MDCTVIAISRTMGAGGEELGHLLASELGFRYVDNEILDRAAAQAGASREAMEKTESRKGLVARVLENLARANVGALYGAADIIADGPATSYEGIIEDVIRAVAGEGKVVIVAHGASIPLAGLPGLLRVLVTASPAARARRVAASDGLDAGKAAAAVTASDRARADFLQRFYAVSTELPTHYDLLLNTDVLTPEQARNAILALVGAKA